ncbi:MAG: H-NS family nucleoid-associated regulatory protein [Betaproteobacteria bacterium]
MDLSSLTAAQLRDLQQQIPAELKRREAQEKVNILKEVQAFAKARGYALEELVGKEIKVKASGGKVKVKYRHPQDASLEWTGRGRQPKWVVEWLGKGNKIEALAV